MTIAAGFNFNDGVLVCADTKHSGTGEALHASKIFAKSDYPNGAVSLFAYAGDMGYCRMAMQHCEFSIAQLPSGSATSQALRAKVESALAKLHREQVYTHPEYSKNLGVYLILALWSPLDGLHAFSTRDSQVMEFPGYDLVGSGEYLGHYLIRQRYGDAGPNPSLEDVTAIATTAMFSIKDHDENCGGRSELVVIRRDGSVSPVKNLDISQGEHVAMGFARVSSKLLLAISKPHLTDTQLDKELETFSLDVEALVKEGRSSRQMLETIQTLKSDDLLLKGQRAGIKAARRARRSTSHKSESEE